MTRMIIAATLMAVGLAAAEAAAQVSFQAPMEFAGTGCGIGSYAVSGDGTDTLTVQFKEMYDAAEPTDRAASRMQRTACSFSIPVNVPPGFQVSTMTTGWYGFAEGKTELFRESFFAGQRGPQKRTNPKGNYTERDYLMHTTWSGCGGGIVPLRINSSVRAITNPSYISIDKMVFQLQSRRCR